MAGLSPTAGAADNNNAASVNLFQPGYLGAPATVAPSYAAAPTAQGTQAQGTQAQAAQLDPNLLASLGSNATIQQLLTGAAPQEQNASNQLTQMLADYGVGGGQAVGAQTQLQAQLMSALAPSIASAIQSSQSNTLNAGEFDTSNQQSTNNLNATQGQQLNEFNATGGQQNNQFNASNALTAALQNAQAGTGASTYNANALNSTNAANVGQQNQSQEELINQMLNQYYAQLGDFSNINTSGQGASNQNAVNYGNDITTTPNPFAQIFGQLAQTGGQLGSAAIAAG